MNVLIAPAPCSFGSQALFADEESRRAAEETYHKYEWAFLHFIQGADLTPAAKLALRMVTTIQPNNVKSVVDGMKSNDTSKNISLVMRENENLEDSSMDEEIKKKTINLFKTGNIFFLNHLNIIWLLELFTSFKPILNFRP